jgi:hypothetical protein
MTQRPAREGAHSPEQGLHYLKDEWRQKSYLEDDCLALTARLDAAIRASEVAAPKRGERGYRLSRADEAQLFAAYGPGSGLSVSAVWHRLVAYQIPLFDSVARERWGNIDLLGLTEAGDPVVVELKIGESQDTPLHALLEAATYAVALRKNWAHVARELEAKELGLAVSAAPTQWRLVLLAPRAYWESWSTRTATGRTVSDSARRAYLQLCEAFAVEYMPVRHAEIWKDKGLSIQSLPDGLPE